MKSWNPKGYQLSVAMNYLEARNLACLNLGIGEREKSESSLRL